ncbi:hypothetical protein BDZ91DRAFT_711738 [Kalaharituber pfeilii]|nr:hypothetical protein BDZ91DRAFT_711738 [Kalaharituber pfeilii]
MQFGKLLHIICYCYHIQLYINRMRLFIHHFFFVLSVSPGAETICFPAFFLFVRQFTWQLLKGKKQRIENLNER